MCVWRGRGCEGEGEAEAEGVGGGRAACTDLALVDKYPVLGATDQEHGRTAGRDWRPPWQRCTEERVRGVRTERPKVGGRQVLDVVVVEMRALHAY